MSKQLWKQAAEWLRLEPVCILDEDGAMPVGELLQALELYCAEPVPDHFLTKIDSRFELLPGDRIRAVKGHTRHVVSYPEVLSSDSRTFYYGCNRKQALHWEEEGLPEHEGYYPVFLTPKEAFGVYRGAPKRIIMVDETDLVLYSFANAYYVTEIDPGVGKFHS
jgi:RNA:NAD 2'-phosphotransferase (TPT1/KptA family)